MKTAAYLRISTVDQTLALQRRGIRRFADHADLDVTEWYCDEGVSGRTQTRPELGRLMQAARRREFSCVVVWKSRAASRVAPRT